MSEEQITFSKYAQEFYRILNGEKDDKDKFVKDLLQLGLDDNGKEIIKQKFPTIITEKGISCIEPSKATILRNYLSGKRGIKNVANEIQNSFHKAYYKEELQNYYEKPKLIEFAKKLKLDTNYNSFKKVLDAIAVCYSDIIEKACRKKSSNSNKRKDNTINIINNNTLLISSPEPDLKRPEDDKHIISSYTITASEKKALINLCKLIKQTLGNLKHLTKTVADKQYRFDHLTAIEEPIKTIIKCEIESLKKRFDECYPELEKLCVDIVELLEPKKNIHPSFGSITSFAQDIRNDKYKITCPDKFNYMAFSLMISKFDDSCNRLIRDIEKI